MVFNSNILFYAKMICLSLLSLGLILFSLGFFGTDYSILTPIGIGTIVAAVFIFVMGVFFVATEEILAKTGKVMKSSTVQQK